MEVGPHGRTRDIIGFPAYGRQSGTEESSRGLLASERQPPPSSRELPPSYASATGGFRPDTGSTTFRPVTSRSTTTCSTPPNSSAPFRTAIAKARTYQRLDRYFAMARGGSLGGVDVTAMEMTKWFDTNYHYLVPELTADRRSRCRRPGRSDDFAEAQALGITTRPVLLGPVSFLLLSKDSRRRAKPRPLGRSVPVYAELLDELAAAGAEWVQIDEPVLGLDLDPTQRGRVRTRCISELRDAAPALQRALDHLLRRARVTTCRLR